MKSYNSQKFAKSQHLHFFANQQTLRANGLQIKILHQKLHLGEKTARFFDHPGRRKSKNKIREFFAHGARRKRTSGSKKRTPDSDSAPSIPSGKGPPTEVASRWRQKQHISIPSTASATSISGFKAFKYKGHTKIH